MDKIQMKFATVIRTDSRKTNRPQTVDLLDIAEVITEDLIQLTTPLTKRKVLAFMMSQYDPLGLLAPLLLIGKLMLRNLYGKTFTKGWDDPLDSQDAKQWLRYITSIVSVGPIEFPRAITTEDSTHFWLVGF